MTSDSQRPVVGRTPGVSRIEDFLLRERSVAEKLLWLTLALATATFARWAAGYFTGGLPLLFYLPAVLFTTMVAGWELGLACLVIATPMGWALFGAPTMFRGTTATATEIITLVVWVSVAACMIALLQFVRIALLGSRHNEERFRKLLDVTSGILWITDGRGRVHAPQPGWTEATGMLWPDYRDHGWLKAIHPEDVGRIAPDRTIPPEEQFNEVEIRLWDAPSADWRWYHARAVPVRSMRGREEWITALREIHDQKLARDKRDLVIGELRHRMKNLVSIIEGLANGSRGAEEPQVDAFLRRFSGRLHALSAAADLVLAGGRVAIECGAVIRATLAPFSEENSNRIVAGGPVIQLSEATGGSLAMAIHELATNAVKYGALSVPEGRVTIYWSVTPVEEGEFVEINWRESGGPRPAPPTREGFGSRVIRAACARERNCEVKVDYTAAGVTCRITFTRDSQGPPAQAAAAD